MNVKPTLHNLIVITLLSALGVLAARALSGTQLGGLPVLGPALKTVGNR